MKKIHKQILRKITDLLGDHPELRFNQALYALDIIQFVHVYPEITTKDHFNDKDEDILNRIENKLQEFKEDARWDALSGEALDDDDSSSQLESGWKEKPLQITRPLENQQTKYVFNGIQCLNCKELINSRHRHDFKYCKCCKVAIDGGLDYIKITGNPEDYLNCSVTNKDCFSLVREFAEWGTHGKLGDQPLTFIKLKNMSDNHLVKLSHYLDTNHFFKELTLKEQKYRKDNNIKVEDVT